MTDMKKSTKAKSTKAKPAGAERGTSNTTFTAEERTAMREYAAEKKKARGKSSKEDGEAQLLAKVAEMPEADRVLAERIHAIVKEVAPGLLPKTWYGMPAYANEDGKVVVFFQDAGKFNYRYSTLGFQDAANLDAGDLWPVSYALLNWSPVVEKSVVELVKGAIS
jgi:uncharacterized protein YdhG (YjbR/CyaY superfamily)